MYHASRILAINWKKRQYRSNRLHTMKTQINPIET